MQEVEAQCGKRGAMWEATCEAGSEARRVMREMRHDARCEAQCAMREARWDAGSEARRSGQDVMQ
jgi:hypothetical protein